MCSTVSSVRRQRSACREDAYGLAVPRSAKPPLRPLAPPPTRRASRTLTRTPASARTRAQARPVTPPPTTATSTRSSRSNAGYVVESLSSQYGTVRPATIDAVCFRHESRELELDEDRGDLRACSAGGSRKLVGPAWFLCEHAHKRLARG